MNLNKAIRHVAFILLKREIIEESYRGQGMIRGVFGPLLKWAYIRIIDSLCKETWENNDFFMFLSRDGCLKWVIKEMFNSKPDCSKLRLFTLQLEIMTFPYSHIISRKVKSLSASFFFLPSGQCKTQTYWLAVVTWYSALAFFLFFPFFTIMLNVFFLFFF